MVQAYRAEPQRYQGLNEPVERPCLLLFGLSGRKGRTGRDFRAGRTLGQWI